MHFVICRNKVPNPFAKVDLPECEVITKSCLRWISAILLKELNVKCPLFFRILPYQITAAYDLE